MEENVNHTQTEPSYSDGGPSYSDGEPSYLDGVLDNALASLPLDEPPTGLHQAIMLQVQAHPRSLRMQRPMPAFRISWLDFALSLFFASMIGLALWIPGWIPTMVRLELNVSWLMLDALRIKWILIGGLATAVLACAMAGFVFTRGFSPARTVNLVHTP